MIITHEATRQSRGHLATSLPIQARRARAGERTRRWPVPGRSRPAPPSGPSKTSGNGFFVVRHVSSTIASMSLDLADHDLSTRSLSPHRDRRTVALSLGASFRAIGAGCGQYLGGIELYWVVYGPCDSSCCWPWIRIQTDADIPLQEEIPRRPRPASSGNGRLVGGDRGWMVFAAPC